MKSFRLILSGCSVVFMTIGLSANEADSVLGKFLPPEKDSVVEIYKCGDKYCGKIACIKDNAYPADSKHGTPGTPYLDHNNEDPKLRTRPNLGMVFVSDFVYDRNGKYKDGKIYDPRSGKTYCSRMEINNNILELRGHLCIASFLGKTNKWTRTSGNPQGKEWDCK